MSKIQAARRNGFIGINGALKEFGKQNKIDYENSISNKNPFLSSEEEEIFKAPKH